MSLCRVYIVLEPLGSARLTFGDDRYYEFMCFDVPKVVRSPGCDNGHDEESRNGRDIKNDILDNVIRTPDEFRGPPDKYPKPSGTFPVSKHSRPIYRSLRLSHFETPRHVPDLIRDSELPSVHQIT